MLVFTAHILGLEIEVVDGNWKKDMLRINILLAFFLIIIKKSKT
jgi:hypothetical protein